MNVYIALLRGINVGGHRKVKMADLKKMFAMMGYTEVVAYIQSGNVIFKSNLNKVEVLEENIKETILKTFGFDVPVLVKTPLALKSIFQKNPFTNLSDIQNKSIYFALLKEAPSSDLLLTFAKEKFKDDLFHTTDNCIYLNYAQGAGKSKLNTNLIENKLKVATTIRNYNTMVKLLALSA